MWIFINSLLIPELGVWLRGVFGAALLLCDQIAMAEDESGVQCKQAH